VRKYLANCMVWFLEMATRGFYMDRDGVKSDEINGLMLSISKLFVRMNCFGNKWDGVVKILCGIVALFTILITIIGWGILVYALFKSTVQLSKTKEELTITRFEKENIKRKADNLVDTFNVQSREAQQRDYELSREKAEPFTLGANAIVSTGETLSLQGMIKYPLSCRNYWLMFIEGDFVWPRMALENQGAPGQSVDITVMVPKDFNKGQIVLACVPQEDHDKFENWLKEGHITSLQKSAEIGFVLSTNLITKGGRL